MNERVPQLSVILPVYNAELYLEEAVMSVLQQSFEWFELLIIDDASTDNTPNILEILKKKDLRIRVFRQEKNLGVAEALNLGLKMARAEYIARMDADDVCLQDRFSLQMEFIKLHPEVTVLGGQMEIMNELGEIYDQYHVPTTHNEIVWNLVFGRSFAHPTVLFKKQSVMDAGGYVSSCIEDLLLWHALFFSGARFANLPQPLVRYRTHTHSVSTKQQMLQGKESAMARSLFLSRMIGKAITADQFCEHLPFVCGEQNRLLNSHQLKKATEWIFAFYKGLKQQSSWMFVPAEETEVFLLHECIRLQSFARGTIAQSSFQDFFRLKVARISDRSVRFFLKALLQPRFAIFFVFQKCISFFKKPIHHSHVPSVSDENKQNGITIVILTYKRPDALCQLLRTLNAQQTGGIPLEIIVVNNDADTSLKKTGLTKTGRALKQFRDLKLFNSSYNWRDAIRYPVALAGRYETILFLDDDIILDSKTFIRYFYETFRGLQQQHGSAIIASGWCSLWKDWTDHVLIDCSMTFEQETPQEPVEVDVCGGGITMFQKDILYDKTVMDAVMRPKRPAVYDMTFAIVSFMKRSARCFYVPMHGLLSFHDQRVTSALSKEINFYQDRYASFKDLLHAGYTPVLKRTSLSDHTEIRDVILQNKDIQTRNHEW